MGKWGAAKGLMIGRDITGRKVLKACDLNLSMYLLGKQAGREGLPLVSELNHLLLLLKYIN